MTRIYQAVELVPNTLLKLDEKASHHLSRVLRATKGEKLDIFNGKGGEYSAIITQIDKKNVEVKIGEFNAREVESPIHIHLAQGIARGEKMDFIVQKAVELGVMQITPLLTEFGNVKLDAERMEKRLEHWQAVAISACEQSGRNQIPQINPPVLLKKWIENHTGHKFVLTPHAKKKLPTTTIIPPGSTITILIGPEGGLSNDEVALSEKNGFISLNLGKRVLRTETATIAALTVLQTRYGDFCN